MSGTNENYMPKQASAPAYSTTPQARAISPAKATSNSSSFLNWVAFFLIVIASLVLIFYTAFTSIRNGLLTSLAFTAAFSLVALYYENARSKNASNGPFADMLWLIVTFLLAVTLIFPAFWGNQYENVEINVAKWFFVKVMLYSFVPYLVVSVALFAWRKIPSMMANFQLGIVAVESCITAVILVSRLDPGDEIDLLQFVSNHTDAVAYFTLVFSLLVTFTGIYLRSHRKFENYLGWMTSTAAFLLFLSTLGYHWGITLVVFLFLYFNYLLQGQRAILTYAVMSSIVFLVQTSVVLARETQSVPVVIVYVILYSVGLLMFSKSMTVMQEATQNWAEQVIGGKAPSTVEERSPVFEAV